MRTSTVRTLRGIAARLPSDLKKELFLAMSADIGRQLKKSNSTEEDIVADFSSWRKKRRAARAHAK